MACACCACCGRARRAAGLPWCPALRAASCFGSREPDRLALWLPTVLQRRSGTSISSSSGERLGRGPGQRQGQGAAPARGSVGA